ncbi:Glycosyltransferase involved in cell wall biogenesis [Photobacterium angustum S14]|uniref:Glycosyltransferase involved in cell wall biogenesis n=1 Tax=Photobacterium angustum (strain S14 / CCUG 15956) TaxID=314292 RepID=Q1ZRU0_PHOAS|nr:glycosyltransferase [Photobacterium angustum]EAS65237.1 Glycosyltransferase involved in cell wall biogenesis [Photobacterium angustum S14]
MLEKVSVYIATHNRIELLKRALNSVRKQTYSNIEIIICDDGSRDGTWEYLKSCNDSNLIILRNSEPLGACVSRNRCINAATGRLITGLDDDDYFYLKRIERFIEKYNLYKEKNFSFLYGDLIINEQNNKFIRKAPKTVTFKDIVKKNHVGNQVFIEKDKIKSELFDESLPAMQDYDLWIRLIKKYGNAIGVQNSGYILDISHPHERISKKSERLIRACEVIIGKNKINKVFNEDVFLLNLYAYGFETHKLTFFKTLNYLKHKSFYRAFKIWKLYR